MLKQKLVLALGLLATTAALADIPPPPGGPFPHRPHFPPMRPTLVMNLQGQDAHDLFDRIKGMDFRSRNGNSVVRVLTTKNNTFRIVCEKFNWHLPNQPRQVSCEIMQSSDGRQLPEFIPPAPIRHG